MKHIVITGRSGSGKTISLRLLEDYGFYCVDNAPISLLPALRDELKDRHEQIAVSIDARNIPADLESYNELIHQAEQPDRDWEIIYVDATDDILLQRFSETKRRHPLTSPSVSLKEAIINERIMLEPIATVADLMIDTSHMNTHELRKLLSDRIADSTTTHLSILFESFGYKHGIPADSDFVFDARCLPNPYWQPELRGATGKDASVQAFLSAQPQAQKMLLDLQQFLDHWIPHMEQDNRRYLTIAVGCTGGQHRSVFLCEQLLHYYQQKHQHVNIRHRELDQHPPQKQDLDDLSEKGSS